MEVKINKKYRLNQSYIDSLTIKPSSNLIEVKLIFGDTLSYSDGESIFNDKIVNIIPNLSELEYTFNAKMTNITPKNQQDNVDPVVVTPTPEPVIPTEPVTPTEPVEPTEPVITPTPEPVTPTEPTTPASPSNPYGEDYI